MVLSALLARKATVVSTNASSMDQRFRAQRDECGAPMNAFNGADEPAAAFPIGSLSFFSRESRHLTRGPCHAGSCCITIATRPCADSTHLFIGMRSPEFEVLVQ